ncbi:unnamed protein product (macronuclear) [Paramecium tetraurelia]|uniref:Uncharacterized protein n=1 Tax=Paramecium tetraurelia TaxID=5888 RepID=A0EBG1_PARTE|nr:uncharacterized protein GSPATT00025362001 [Paramecium tetraurelia]CAK92628.1 unnamed protein product [Paramecium tetraurelia]|eukprot:XP_001460025.1 hypothetical protein (macronuclear) [Paramecium tetraurelia strain d4-2]
MSKIPVQEMKQYLDQRIDYNSHITQVAMKKLGLTQRALQRMNYLEYMTSNTSQQDYFLYLHAVAMNIKKLQQEIVKMSLKDKSIDCTDTGNVEEIIALLDKRMKHKNHTSSQPCVTSNRDRTCERDDSIGCEIKAKQKIIRLTNQGIKSITERDTLKHNSTASQNSICDSSSPEKFILKKLVISNNQSIADLFQKQQASIDVSTMEKLNESMRKLLPDKNLVIMTGIKHRIKDSQNHKKSMDEFMQKITKLRSLSQQSIDSERKLPSLNIKQTQQKQPNLISTKLEMMLRKEKMIREEPLKIHQVKLGNIMGVISKIRNQQTKWRMFHQLNNDQS